MRWEAICNLIFKTQRRRTFITSLPMEKFIPSKLQTIYWAAFLHRFCFNTGLLLSYRRIESPFWYDDKVEIFSEFSLHPLDSRLGSIGEDKHWKFLNFSPLYRQKGSKAKRFSILLTGNCCIRKWGENFVNLRKTFKQKIMNEKKLWWETNKKNDKELSRAAYCGDFHDKLHFTLETSFEKWRERMTMSFF